MAGYRPVIRLGRSVADHDHRFAEAGLTLLGLTAGLAAGPAGAEGLRQVPAQFSQALDIEGLVDRLVVHVHLRPVGKVLVQVLDDLFRTPAPAQTLLYVVPQLRVLGNLPGLGAGPARVGAGLGGMRPVLAVDGVAVAAYLAADRRWAAAQVRGDPPDRRLRPHLVGDVETLLQRQVPRRGRGPLSPHSVCGLSVSLLRCVGAVAPALAGTPVEADDPARSRLLTP
ncbi:hypothetical protein GCM10014713_44610 [Streptomyces purpureus]|uniref:Uncharacterized protein n=1 Tax=Streptomyces purpureus TaxID=1951 RepID=A0A918H8F9_9ACTN|nr:hypothetical protein GCM10014713_44610 [Streptomyces purpureus]